MSLPFFDQFALTAHIPVCVASVWLTKSEVLAGVGVILACQAAQQAFLVLYAYTAVFLRLSFVVARVKFEKMPTWLVKVEPALCLLAGPLLVVVLSYLFPSPRYLHVVQFGCVKLLVSVMVFHKAAVVAVELLLSVILFVLWGLAPPLLEGGSFFSSALVSLLVVHLALLARRSVECCNAPPLLPRSCCALEQ